MKHVNLTDHPVFAGTKAIPPRHLSVREHYYRNERGSVKNGRRVRDIPLSDELVEMLLEVRRTSRFIDDNDPVFASRNGTPINEGNLLKRVIQPSAVTVGLPSIGWHTLRHTFATLTSSLGVSVNDRMALMGHSSVHMTDRYTHPDRERMRDAISGITSRLMMSQTES
jgi:integrase